MISELQELAECADLLDGRGMYEEANVITAVLHTAARTVMAIDGEIQDFQPDSNEMQPFDPMGEEMPDINMDSEAAAAGMMPMGLPDINLEGAGGDMPLIGEDGLLGEAGGPLQMPGMPEMPEDEPYL